MEPNTAHPQRMEMFVEGLAKLFIKQYQEDLPPNDSGYFSPRGQIDAKQEEVEQDFMENWFEYTPPKTHIDTLMNKMIGPCRHIFTLIIPFDDEFQKRVCRKVGEIFTDFVSDIIEEAEDMYEAMDVDESSPPTAYNPLLCRIHLHPPIIERFQQFCKEFTSRMFGNFVRGVPFQRKKLLYLSLERDMNETLAENALNLESDLLGLWSYLLPTTCQIRSAIHNVYGFPYKLMENHTIPHDDTFRYIVRHQLMVRIRQYLTLHKDIFKETAG